MSADALHEAVFAHAGPRTEEEYSALPETPARIELVDGAHREYATAPDGVLRLDRPWRLRADLRAPARGRQ